MVEVMWLRRASGLSYGFYRVPGIMGNNKPGCDISQSGKTGLVICLFPNPVLCRSFLRGSKLRLGTKNKTRKYTYILFIIHLFGVARDHSHITFVYYTLSLEHHGMVLGFMSH